MASSIRRLIGLFKKTHRPHKVKQWQDFEYFDAAWKERIQLMARYIPKSTHSIADIGCGKMWLKEFLSPGIVYYGIDYIYRGPGSHVFDLNKHGFPEKIFDVAFVSGCLEYICDHEWLIKKIAANTTTCVASYCTVDLFNNRKERISLGWVNHLSESQLIELFDESNMKLVTKDKTSTSNSIYVFSK